MDPLKGWVVDQTLQHCTKVFVTGNAVETMLLLNLFT
jgi:hypothetical protein